MSDTIFSVQILDAWDETASLRALRLDLGEAGAHHHRVGQFLRCKSGSGAEDFFALSTAPGEPHAEVLLKRGGPVADEIIAHPLRHALKCSAPVGAGFPLERAPDRDLLLFAAGSGIGPIRAVLHAIKRGDARAPRSTTLYYGQQFAADFAFTAELAALVPSVHVVLCASRADCTFHGEIGYVQTVADRRKLDGAEPQHALAFLCGPSAMVTGVQTFLRASQLADDQIFLNF